MKYISELGSTFSKTVIALIIAGGLAIYGVYWCQKTINEIDADEIIHSVLELAQREKSRIDSENSEESEEDSSVEQDYKMEQQKYAFVIKEGSTSELVQIETGKKTISHGVCNALKAKFKETQWHDVFDKVVVIDRLGEEKTDVLIYGCPRERIPALRFYVHFVNEESETEALQEEVPLPEPNKVLPTSVSVSAPVPRSNTPVRVPSYSSKQVCPSGTSAGGAGGIATSGCRCNGAGEFWNGRICETRNCPSGSSKGASGTGDLTNVSGCRCHSETPVWSGTRCIKKCSGNKVSLGTECVCPSNMIPKEDSSDFCVECNTGSDCSTGRCVDNRCASEDYIDCRWGVCQTCDGDKKRTNLDESQVCEVAGLSGMCNGNGTCYPMEGRRCSSKRGCPSGNFCNYGGTLNGSKKQKGKFGRTPNVCQVVNPLEFVHKDVTYYYNSEKDLKSWCRAANNKPNCKWGYLAKPGAESWCASLGKRLLTKDEMANVWPVLKKVLPQTYTGYAYWIQEGVWLEDKNAKRGFSKKHPDGYGGRGGVVCK